MPIDMPREGLQVTSTLASDGQLTLELAHTEVATPGPDQIVIRVEATPVNPSDLMTLIPGEECSQASFGVAGGLPRVSMQLPGEVVQAHAGRLDQALTVGITGAGTVVAAGEGAGHLLGKRVSAMSLERGFFGQYCTLSAQQCLTLPDDVSFAEGADVFCNPMTALAIAETVRLEGQNALIHTAAASNLGQMLVRICAEDGMELVNIVRRKEQVELLRDIGATHVCNSSDADFDSQLARAIAATGARMAFDAIGGGTMAHQLMSAMEADAAAKLPVYSPYGSFEKKQVFVYGRLDPRPITLEHATYGLLWNLEAWVMPPIMERVGPARSAQLQRRVIDGLKSTFTSHYCATVSLFDALQEDAMSAYCRGATAGKYLINPALPPGPEG